MMLQAQRHIASSITMLLRHPVHISSLVKLTEHAKVKIKERNIELSDALVVLERPSEVFYDTITGCNIALASWKSRPGKHLLVSYILEDMRRQR